VHVGLDVHKDSIDIALAEATPDSEVRHLGTVVGGSDAVTKALRRLISSGHRLHIVYEAGPCGFALQRHFARLGWHCEVVAPSSIPRPPGERVKTDRRDAMKLARLARVGELTAVRVPAWPAGTGWSFQEFSRRSGDFAIVGVAATVRLDSKGNVGEARLAFSGVDQVPVRATAAESLLAGAAPSDDLWKSAAQAAATPLAPGSDIHGSAAYRRQLAAVLAERALREAHDRAKDAR